MVELVRKVSLGTPDHLDSKEREDHKVNARTTFRFTVCSGVVLVLL